MKKTISAIGALLLLPLGLVAATAGSCESAAIALKASQAVTLVGEYDKEERTYDDYFGIAVYKITLSRGASATIWISGGNAEDLDLNVAESDDYEDFLMASFDYEDYSSGVKAAFLEYDSWDFGDGTREDPGDPSRVTFYVKISGEIGMKTSLYYQSGIKSFTVTGEEGSPKTLTFKTTEQTVSDKLVGDNGEYWFKAKLTAGHKYVVRTTTANENLDISCDSADVDMIEDLNYTANCVKYWLVPEATGTYKFYVGGDDYGTKFTLKYKAVPQRAPAAHPFTDLVEANNFSAAVVPGRLNVSHDYYDAVADESLCRIYLAKGERKAFETVGAEGDIALSVYDKDGKVLVTNTTKGNASKDCLAAITASAAGYYYIGVYDPLLDVQDEPPAGVTITLRAIACDEVAPVDAFDPVDDVASASTASLLTAASSDKDADVVAAAAAEGVAHGPHAFNVGDWYDCYRLPVRKGVTYRLRASLVDEEDMTDLSLGVKVFTLSSGKETAVTTKGALFPQDGEDPLSFTAAANAVYYVRVWVLNVDGKAGYGLDFPKHMISAAAHMSDGTALGLLQVKTKGANATWYIGTDGKSYPNGASVNVVGSQKVVFNAVDGFATPAAQTASVQAGGKVVVTGVYNDSYDKYTKTVNKKKVTVSDDDEAYAIALSKTAAKNVSSKRTLWTNDPEDNFKFTAEDGVYYNFAIEDTTLDGEGDAVLAIFKDGVEVVPATKSVEKRMLPAGAYILKVSHANPGAPVDSSYTLVHSTVSAGKVKFAAATYTAKESDASVALKVQRTDKEGVVRVKWATQAGEGPLAAQPGKEYYPAEGEIVWNNGDKADKTISVRLIPDLVATVEGNKTFAVRLWEVDADDIEDAEYPAVITRDTATVALTEVTAKGAGTVAAVSYGVDETPFASQKKPVMTVKAGGTADITLRRSAYTGLTKVAVKATVVVDKKKYGDTAVIGKDVEAFSEIVEWNEGDDDEQTISIPLEDSSDYTLTKQFTVTLSAMTTGAYKGWDKPTLAASAITVKIGNETAASSFSSYSKSAEAAGVTAKATKGSWFVDGDGALRSAEAATAVMSLSVTGPGLFVADPSVGGAGCGTLTCKIGKGEAFVCSGSGLNRFARIVPAGKQDIVFTLVDGTPDDYVAFDPVDDEGSAFKWVPFSKVAAAMPLSKAVVKTDDVATLSWSEPEPMEEEGVFYRVRIGNSANSQQTQLTNATVDTYCAIPEGLLVPGKTWYWTLDFAVVNTKEEITQALADPSVLMWTAGPSVWNFTTVADDVRETKTDGVDIYGADFEDAVTNGLPIQLIQGMATAFEIGPDIGNSVKSRVLAGSLPPGLTLDGAAKKGKVSGVPTKAGVYTCLLQTATGTEKKPVWATTMQLTFEVLPAGTSVGSFRGVLVEDGSALETGAPRIGLLTFTATAAGKLTAKATVAGKSYSFSKTGFGDLVDLSVDGQSRVLETRLTMNKTYSKVKYVNELVVTLNDDPVTNLDSFVDSIGTASLRLNVPNSKETAVIAEAEYTAALYRDNSAVAAEALAPFKGYYTVALAAPGVTADDGVPAGHGYLTLTVDAKGAVKVTGRLADGTSVSGSTVGTLVGDYNAPETCELVVPVAFSSASYSFGGLVKIAWDEGEDGYAASVVDAQSTLRWYKDGASATLGGDMLDLELEPSGGWYNTTLNLQRYYLDRDFTLDGVEVTLAGNAVKLAATKGDTVSAITYSLARATGLVTGTLTYAGVKKINHYGVLLMNRDAGATALDPDVWTAGFFKHKVNSSWTESLPFDILSVEMDRDWNEAAIPSGD